VGTDNFASTSGKFGSLENVVLVSKFQQYSDLLAKLWAIIMEDLLPSVAIRAK